MDGAQLLERIRERHPGAVRIVLSGQSDAGTALRAVLVAHIALAKPCDPEHLQAVLERACDLHSLLHNTALQRTAGGAPSLPPAPLVYRELVRALADPDVGVRAVAAIVERDPALGAKVVQLVNSAFFGLGRRIAGIEEAVTYLGIANVRGVALALSAYSALANGDSPQLERIRLHSLACAKAAATALGQPPTSEDAFLAGLLHDVGKLVLALDDPGYPANVEAAMSAERISEVEAESALYGCSHAEVGAYLLSLWGLPFDIVEAVANHHGAPADRHQRPLVWAVQRANALAAEDALALFAGDNPSAAVSDQGANHG